MTAPLVSVIMPVFNTGAYLREAVASVLNQRDLAGQAVPPFELIIVDDGSTDPVTLDILNSFSHVPNLRMLRNARGKGAAGARNTGIEAAAGQWISFLDSDDLLFPYALARRWQVACEHPDAAWIAARFRLLRPAPDQGTFESAAALLDMAPPAGPPKMRRLPLPVAAFAAECMVGIMSVLIRRDLVIAQGMFDERLPRSEDYYLWFQCAREHDLWLLEEDVAWYRIHTASLTHGDAPRFLHEERMLELMLGDHAWQPHRRLLVQRLDVVMQDHCYFYRSRRRFQRSLGCALYWLRRRPVHAAAWKELLASGLRFS
ncbi:glycosyltransferase family 2 protein [Pseudoduganella sp. UC29_106]|uniref:glycosyltransferase family 2 protein n=1 Tax=Pseudoduganella sp. UC29_106 TaxID=3374553 RepID=UPI00375664AB